jgi:hypothetical protein
VPSLQQATAPELFVGPSGKRLKCCRPCLDKAQVIARRHRERIGAAGVRAANLRDKYGMTVAEYDALREKQDYRCAICGRHEDELPVTAVGRPRRDGRPTATAFKLAVDHCHSTGRVRGLLCVGCNAAIGHFRDDRTVVLAALTYLGGPP